MVWLQEGEYYSNRAGQKVGPVVAIKVDPIVINSDNIHSVVFKTKDGSIQWYSNGMSMLDGTPLMSDLVEVWSDHKHGHDPEKYMIEVLQGFLDGKPIETKFKELDKWHISENPKWNWDRFDYRIAEPKIQDSVNWDHVAPEYICHARNEDGSVFLCSDRPRLGVDEWYNRGQFINAYYFTSFQRGTTDWRDSLVFRSGYGPKEN